MRNTVIARPIGGITINNELEFLLDNSGSVQVFDNPEQAKLFLDDAGIDPEEQRHMILMESCGTCCRCGNPLLNGCTFK